MPDPKLLAATLLQLRATPTTHAVDRRPPAGCEQRPPAGCNSATLLVAQVGGQSAHPRPEHLGRSGEVERRTRLVAAPRRRGLHVIAYASRVWTRTQRRYSMTELIYCCSCSHSYYDKHYY